MVAKNTAAAPTEAEAAASHKEDNKVVSSPGRVADWQDQVIAWYSGGPRPIPSVVRVATEYGLPPHPPDSPKDRVKALALAGFGEEAIMAGVPELSPSDVIRVIDRIPGQVYSIIGAHKLGYTPIEIAQTVGVSRPRVYYWLRQAGLQPHRRNRPELTARQRSQIVRAYNEGEPIRSLVKRFGVSADQVRYAISLDLGR